MHDQLKFDLSDWTFPELEYSADVLSAASHITEEVITGLGEASFFAMISGLDGELIVGIDLDFDEAGNSPFWKVPLTEMLNKSVDEYIADGEELEQLHWLKSLCRDIADKIEAAEKAKQDAG